MSVNLYHKKSNSQPRPALLLIAGRLLVNPKIPDSPSRPKNPGQQGKPAFRLCNYPSIIYYYLHKLVTNTTEEYAIFFLNIQLGLLVLSVIIPGEKEKGSTSYRWSER